MQQVVRKEVSKSITDPFSTSDKYDFTIKYETVLTVRGSTAPHICSKRYLLMHENILMNFNYLVLLVNGAF